MREQMDSTVECEAFSREGKGVMTIFFGRGGGNFNRGRPHLGNGKSSGPQ